MTEKAQRLLMAVVLALVCIPAAIGRPNQEQAGSPEVGRISVDELILLMSKKSPLVVIDVRGKDSYDSKIKGALQIPVDEIEQHLKDIPKDKEVITYCA